MKEEKGQVLLSCNTYDQQPPDRDQGTAVLIVDDEQDQRVRIESICRQISEEMPIHVESTDSLATAMEALASRVFHVLLLDKNFKEGNGAATLNAIEAIPDILYRQPNLQILMISADDSVGDVVSAMRKGAYGYVSKGDRNPLVRVQIEKALQVAKIMTERARAEHARAKAGQHDVTLVGKSEVTQHMLRKLIAVAQSDKPVLLEGESGSGKTTAARLIHNYRAHFLKQPARPMLEFNISALSSTVVESELFGHEKGAYTGAINRKQGIVELANGGTLFADEIGDMPLETQVKLLKVVEGGAFFRVGAPDKPLFSNFKLISATHKNLEELVEQGLFRFDFYSRISTFVVKIPSLRERQEDIPEIIEAIFPKCLKESHTTAPCHPLPSEFISYIQENPPPENIRGLENQLHRLLAFSNKDRNGALTFSNWRSILDYNYVRTTRKTDRASISTKEITTLPIELDGDFPGFTLVMDHISQKILKAAQQKFKTNREIARYLKLSDGAVSVRLKQLKTQENAATDGNGKNYRRAGS